MGWWSLKPREDLDPYDCLAFGDKDDLGEDMIDLMDLITIDVEEGYELTESDVEYLTNEIKRGMVAGQINDWDWKSDLEEGDLERIQLGKIRELLLDPNISAKEEQRLLHEHHTESNCRCDSDNSMIRKTGETATMISEGAGDIEICLDCFGAKGYVY